MVGRVACIHQPPFLPWLGIIESMLVCDVFVVDDAAQFTQRGYQNRNLIKTAQGASWLTLPVRKRFGERVNEVQISHEYEPKKIVASLRMNYGRARAFSAHFAEIAQILQAHRYGRLCEINLAFMEYVAKQVGAQCSFFLTSTLAEKPGKLEDRLPSLCKQVGASLLYTGSGMRSYMPEAGRVFRAHGIDVVWHDYERRHAVYPQQFPKLGFIPCLSAVDMLFNVGADEMRRVLLQSGHATMRAAMLARLSSAAR